MPPLGLGRRQGNVRFGSKAEVKATNIDVRFAPESGHLQCTSACPLCANSGHSEMSKVYPH